MFVICQNDYPLAVVSGTEDEVKIIQEKIQNKCDEITKKLYPQYGQDFRQIFIHIRKVPETQSILDVDDKLYWNNWDAVAQYKKEVN